jgi:hypothetical protein
MITAKEAREQFNNSKLIQFLKKVGDKAVKEDLAAGRCSSSFSIYDAPSSMTRAATAEVAVQFYSSFGYNASAGSNNTRIYLDW